MTRWRQPYLQIACECTRNLARVKWQHYRQADHSNIRVEAVSSAGALPHEHRDADRIGPRLSYQWQCRCGRTWECRHERIAAWWQENIGDGRPARVMTVFLGRDL